MSHSKLTATVESRAWTANSTTPEELFNVTHGHVSLAS